MKGINLELVVSDWDSAKRDHDAGAASRARWSEYAEAKAELEEASFRLRAAMIKTDSWTDTVTSAETHLSLLMERGDKDGAQAVAKAIIRYREAKTALREAKARISALNGWGVRDAEVS